MNHIRLLILSIILSFSLHGFAQEFALKSNLLYDAMTTPNLGVEIGLPGRSTLNIVYGLNPWTFGSGDNGQRKAKHWVVQPEYRWWHCSKFNGSFIGVHALGGQLNAANVDIPVPGFFFNGDNLQKGVKDYRYEARFAGAGVTYFKADGVTSFYPAKLAGLEKSEKKVTQKEKDPLSAAD